MAKLRIGSRLLAGLLLCGGVSAVSAAPTAGQMLGFQPKQTSITITTPTEVELPACKVELMKGGKNASGKTPSGWLLRDASKQPVRCFLDTDGDNKIDVWSYYVDGQECYREIDSNFNEKADQYRWLGPNGSKWGVDLNEDGRIDSWKVISPEEVSQELLQAVITRDYARLNALMITQQELTGIELPSTEETRIRESITAAPQKFQKTTAGLINLTAKTQWVHLELSAPQTIAADALGSKVDLVRLKGGTILYENAGKHDWLQTGEMVQVGKAWRLIDSPVPGSRVEHVSNGSGESGPIVNVPDEAKPILEELKKVDASSPKTGDPTETARYYLARAVVLEKIVGVLKEGEEPWIKQLADSLGGAAEAGGSKDQTAYSKLLALRDQLAKKAPGSSIAAYVTYRELSAEYAVKLSTATTGEQMTKVQQVRRDRLKKFVDDYPSADDTADAMMQLGMVNEFMGNEIEAKNWYGQIVKHFPKDSLAPKANGAVRRLGLEGQQIEVVAPKMSTDESFDIAAMKGKVVVVYYWASWNGQSASDFTKLKSVMNSYGPKGVELVAVNLDNAKGDAMNFVAQNSVPGTHLHQAGGLDSPLATQYGIFVLPNMLLVGKDGKVVSRSVQLATLEDELKKVFGN